MDTLIATIESWRFIEQAQVQQFRHEFKGFGVHASSCLVTIFRHEGAALVVLQDIGHGTSVTNACEQIATEIALQEGLDLARTSWCECYPYHGGDWGVDAITFEHSLRENKLKRPSWKRITNGILVDYLHQSLKPIHHEKS